MITSVLFKLSFASLLFLSAGATVLARIPQAPALQTIPLSGETAQPVLKPESVDKNGIITNVSQPSFVVYLPAAGKENNTGIIICPGGGYQALDYHAHVELVAPIFNKAGITVFGLKYRLAPPSKNAPADALSDLTRTIKVIRSRAAEWKVVPNRIGVLGYSAGSHLALCLMAGNDSTASITTNTLERISSRPDFVILMCPWPFGGTIRNFHLHKNTPPTYIAQAEDDDIAPAGFAKAIKNKLESCGVPVELRLVPKGGHLAFNFSASSGKPAVGWTDEVITWLGKRGFIADTGRGKTRPHPQR